MGTRLTALDIAFLALETQRSPVNIAGLGIFEIPRGYKGNFVRDLLDQMIEQESGNPFNLKLNSTNLINIPEWVEDEQFDLDYHVRHSALPKPGSMEDLLNLVSRLHSRVMDREQILHWTGLSRPWLESIKAPMPISSGCWQPAPTRT